MQVSFIVPSFNQGRFIGACLDSIAAQGLAADSFEVLVMDGGSSDDTASIVTSHPLNPTWVSEPDRGQAHAVNKGLARARSELIGWINSDDYYFPGVWPQVIQAFAKAPAMQVLYGQADHTDAQGHFVRPYGTEPWNYTRLLDICFLCQPATVFRRSIYEQCGGLNEAFHVGADLEYWLRVGKVTTPVQTELKIAAARLWGDTKSARQQFEMQEEALRLSYLYGPHWSPRRVRGLAQNHARLRHPWLDSSRWPCPLLLHFARHFYVRRLQGRLRHISRESCWTEPVLRRP